MNTNLESCIFPHGYYLAEHFEYQQGYKPRLTLSLQDNASAKFIAIASLYSELVAINTHGQLCQWKWSDPEPYLSMEVRIELIYIEKLINRIAHVGGLTLVCYANIYTVNSRI